MIAWGRSTPAGKTSRSNGEMTTSLRVPRSALTSWMLPGVLLDRPKIFTRCLLMKLLEYGTGRAIDR